MATETILEVMGKTKYDGKGDAILQSFKRIEMHSKKEIRKMKRKHKIPKTSCSSVASVCTRQDEMRWIKVEKAFECSFSRVGNESFADVLKWIHSEQNKTGFEKHRLYSVQLYLADDPDKDVRPSETSIGVILNDVQIRSFEESGTLVMIEFAGPKNLIPILTP